jgi:hypothetical protein
MAARYLRKEFSTRMVALVPVPNNRSDRSSSRKPRTTVIAEAIAAQGGARFGVHDILRWEGPITPSRKGEPGNALVLVDRLVLMGTIPGGPAIVLVDDLLDASAGHVRACYAFLADHGMRLARAVCAGRTTMAPVKDPFRPIDEIV